MSVYRISANKKACTIWTDKQEFKSKQTGCATRSTIYKRPYTYIASLHSIFSYGEIVTQCGKKVNPFLNFSSLKHSMNLNIPAHFPAHPFNTLFQSPRHLKPMHAIRLSFSENAEKKQNPSANAAFACTTQIKSVNKIPILLIVITQHAEVYCKRSLFLILGRV